MVRLRRWPLGGGLNEEAAAREGCGGGVPRRRNSKCKTSLRETVVQGFHGKQREPEPMSVVRWVGTGSERSRGGDRGPPP